MPWVAQNMLSRTGAQEDLDACRGELRRAESTIEAEVFEKSMAGRCANTMTGLVLALLAAL